MTFEFIIINNQEEIICSTEGKVGAEIIYQCFNAWNHYTGESGDGSIVWYGRTEFLKGITNLCDFLTIHVDENTGEGLIPSCLSQYFIFLEEVTKYLSHSTDNHIAVVYQ
jgi:hypothetical protein